MSEYSNSAVSRTPCEYSNLSKYLDNNNMPKLRPGTVSGSMVIPTFGPDLQYESLTHRVHNNCGPYFNVCNAYPCQSTQYHTKLCGHQK